MNNTETNKMNSYEGKRAIKVARTDARKALRDWHKYHTIGIDTILKGMGYSKKSSYKYEYHYWVGMNKFRICLDTYGLIIGNTDNIDIEVQPM